MRKDLFKRPLHTDAWCSWLKLLLDTLLVIFINYLYSNSIYEFMCLVKPCRVMLLESPLLPASGQMWEQEDWFPWNSVGSPQLFLYLCNLKMWLRLLGTSPHLSASIFKVLQASSAITYPSLDMTMKWQDSPVYGGIIPWPIVQQWKALLKIPLGK